MPLERTSPPPADASTAAADERRLVERLRLGDTEAFDEIFRAYYRPLVAFVVERIGSPQVAEECVQEVFLRVWARRAAWHVTVSVRSYLYAAARNHARQYANHARVIRQWEIRAVRGDVPTGMSRGGGQPDDRLQRLEMDAAIARTVAALPGRCRQAYQLRTDHDLTYPEIADVMRISVKGVEALLNRAFCRLRERLATFT